MRVSITNSHKDEVLWLTDNETNMGLACYRYNDDGTQDKIIEALEYALTQAKAQRGDFGEAILGYDIKATISINNVTYIPIRETTD